MPRLETVTRCWEILVQISQLERVAAAKGEAAEEGTAKGGSSSSSRQGGSSRGEEVWCVHLAE